jgi:hypothetical protein
MVGRKHVDVKGLSFTASKWLSFKNAMLNTLSKGGDQVKMHILWILSLFLGQKLQQLEFVDQLYDLRIKRRLPCSCKFFCLQLFKLAFSGPTIKIQFPATCKFLSELTKKQSTRAKIKG